MTKSSQKKHFFVQWISPCRIAGGIRTMVKSAATFDATLEDAIKRVEFAKSEALVPLDGFIYEVAHQRGMKNTAPETIGEVPNSDIDKILDGAIAHLPPLDEAPYVGEKHAVTSTPVKGLLFYVDIVTPNASGEKDIIVVPHRLLQEDSAFNVHDVLDSHWHVLPDTAQIRDLKAYEVVITDDTVIKRGGWAEQDTRKAKSVSLLDCLPDSFRGQRNFDQINRFVALTGEVFDMPAKGRFLAYQEKVRALRKEQA